jgi:FAD/FMN-containing dehydrogenase
VKHAIVNGGHDLRRPEGTADIDLEALERDLRRSVRGEVRFDPAYRAIYSHDSSNYRQQAIGVVVPDDQEAVVAAITACRAAAARRCRARRPTTPW